MLNFTGERYIPNLNLPEISYEHWHRYIWLQQLVVNKRVLDIACGEGYGSKLIADVAAQVVGVDISEEAINYATSKYIQPNLEFLCGSAAEIPVDGHYLFDVIVSFETIEHLDEADQQRFMLEAKRLLRPDGLIFISTPNKLFYTDIPKYNNEFHMHEFYLREYMEFLKKSFLHTHMLGQRVYPGSYLWPLGTQQGEVDEYQLEFLGTHFQPAYGDKKEALYLIAVCSDTPISELPLLQHRSTLIDISDQAIGVRKALVDEQDLAITRLRSWIDERDAHIHRLAEENVVLRAKYDSDIHAFHAWIAERDVRLAKQEGDINAIQKQTNQQRAEIDQRDILIIQQQSTNEQLVQVAEERADSITRLEAQQALLHNQLAGQALQLAAFEVNSTSQLEQAQVQLQQIQSSFGWKLLHPLWRLRERVLPHHSLRSKALRAGWRSGQIMRTHGIRELARRGTLKIFGRTEQVAETSIISSRPVVILPSDYDRWIAENEPDVATLWFQASEASQWANAPLISILTPVYHTPPTVLSAMIESVLAQTYPNWKLVLINGSPENQEATAVLRSYAERDRRIQHVPLTANLGIVGNTNAGIEHIQGTYIAFVDHDDLLAPFALFEVAKAIQNDKTVDMIYSDSDLINTNGRRAQPLFKPDWSPAILYSSNYITHLCVVRSSLFRELEGLTPGSDGAQDWDMLLRIGERTSAIIHIPKILYHWRESASSTATDIKQKPYAMHAQVEAITRHLRRTGLPATAYFDTNGYIRVGWSLSGKSKVSIIIPSRKLELVERCIASLFLRTDYRHFDVTIIDTTKDGVIQQAYTQRPQKGVQVITNTKSFNYSAVNNQAVTCTDGNVLLFLNDDTEAIDATWLSEIVRWIELDWIGIVGPKLLRSDRHIQHAGVVIGLGGFAGHPFDSMGEGSHTIFGCTEWYRNYSAVTGACLAIRRDVFQKIGGFDETMVLCGSDIALCLSVSSLGLSVMYTPFSRMLHLESVTRGTDIPPQDFAISYQYYRNLLANGDPFFNRNLSVWSSIPRLCAISEEAPLAFAQRHLTQLGISLPDTISSQG